MKERFEKAKDILRREGFSEMIKRSFSSIIRCFFEYKVYFLYENNLDHEFVCLPKIKNYTFRTISTINEVDVLVSEGFNVESYYAGMDALKERINKGAILFVAFINQELAHTSWVALTDKAKKDIDPLPYSIDYRNEACSGDSRTYQGIGFYGPIRAQISSILHKRGIKKVKFAISKNNFTLQRFQAKFGSRIYGELTCLKLLIWEFHWEKGRIQTYYSNSKSTL